MLNSRTSLGGFIAAACIGLTAAARPLATEITLSNLRLNLQGLILVDATLKQAPPPMGGVMDVEFSYSDGEGTFTETVRSTVGAYNVARTVASRRPFPCDKRYEVTATLKTPASAPVYTKSVLTRKCTRSEGTPDLVVVSAVRADGGGLNSPRGTPIRIRVIVANVGQNMAFNEQGGTPWTVQLTPGASGNNDGGTGGVQRFALPLSANQRHTLDVYPVALPCGKQSPVEVWVDRDNVIAESSEANNKRTFLIAGNRCQDS